MLNTKCDFANVPCWWDTVSRGNRKVNKSFVRVSLCDPIPDWQLFEMILFRFFIVERMRKAMLETGFLYPRLVLPWYQSPVPTDHATVFEAVRLFCIILRNSIIILWWSISFSSLNACIQ